MIDPREWVRVLAASMPGVPTPARASRLAVYAPRLTAEFPRQAFTLETARDCGRNFHALPDYDALASTLRHVMPEISAPSGPPSEDVIYAQSWDRHISGRLAQGGDRAKLLSFVRAHAPPSQLRNLLSNLFPADLREMDEHDAEVIRDKAMVAQRAAELAKRMAPPPLPRFGAKAPAPEPVRPVERLLTGEALIAARQAQKERIGA